MIYLLLSDHLKHSKLKLKLFPGVKIHQFKFTPELKNQSSYQDSKKLIIRFLTVINCKIAQKKV